MNSSLVTVIIPTYNRAHIIDVPLKSIEAQTYTNWECLIIDDGSTDATHEVVKSYSERDDRFKYFKRPSNRLKGANACRNYGLEISNGDYINWFDSDDAMHPEKLEIQLSKLSASHYDYSICQTMMCNYETGVKIGLRADSLISNNLFNDYLLQKVFWLTGAPLWKKDFLIKNRLIFDEKLQQAQDYDFHMRVLDISQNYCPINDELVLFYHHNSNMSNSTTDSADKIFSNIIVSNNILTKYNHKIDHEVVVERYFHLFSCYKIALLQNQKNNFNIAYTSLLKNLYLLRTGRYYKLKYLIKLKLSYWSFVLFGRGYFLLKNGININ